MNLSTPATSRMTTRKVRTQRTGESLKAAYLGCDHSFLVAIVEPDTAGPVSRVQLSLGPIKENVLLGMLHPVGLLKRFLHLLVRLLVWQAQLDFHLQYRCSVLPF